MIFFLTSRVLFIAIIVTGECRSEECTGLIQGMCCSGQIWNNVSNSCDYCPPGYYGKNCSTICQQPYYGMRCLNECNCSESDCNPIFGCNDSVTSPNPDALSLRTEQTSNDIKLPVFAPDSSSITVNSSPLEITVAGLSVILCLGLVAYVGMAIFEKTVHIRYAMHTRNTERNVHYENVNGATDHIEFY